MSSCYPQQHPSLPDPYLAICPPKIRHPNRPPCTTPSSTLYLRNLNEKTKTTVLADALKTMFETYGEILDVRVRHSIRMRGQGFVVFKHREEAVIAHREVQGFMLLGKPMFIEFARAPSDATIADQGGDVEEYKRQRTEARELREKEEASQKKPTITTTAKPILPQANLPNKILFLQGLPAGIQVPEIESAFAAFPGFVEVRWVSVKPDVAFIEYESEIQATIPKNSLGPQWQVRPDAAPVSVTFANR